MRPLEELSLDDFARVLHETFVVHTDSGEVPLELIEVRDGYERPNARRSFSLTFRGPAGPAWPQRIYRMTSPQLGVLEIFLVPLGPDAAGQRYEAVFG